MKLISAKCLKRRKSLPQLPDALNVHCGMNLACCGATDDWAPSKDRQ